MLRDMIPFLLTLLATLALAGVVGYTLAALIIKDDDEVDFFSEE